MTDQELIDQTIDTFRKVVSNKYTVPVGFILEAIDRDDSGDEWFTCLVDGERVQAFSYAYHYRLVPIPQPKRVPIEYKDVPPGSVFSFNPEHEFLYPLITVDGIEYRSAPHEYDYSWAELVLKNCQIHRPGGTWEPCSKLEGT